MTKTLFSRTTIAGCALLATLSGCTASESDPIATEKTGDENGPASMRYVVHPDPDHPKRLLAQLDLSHDSSIDRTAFVRGLNFGLVSQVSSPDCDGIELVADGDGQWKVPDPCHRLSWSIELLEAAPGGVDSSAQQSLYFPGRGWWLLSEPTSLLRLSSTSSDELLSLRVEGLSDGQLTIGATRLEEGTWRVPPIESAPEFFAFGNLETQQHNLGRMYTTYVLDDVDRFSRLPLLELHRHALTYLAEVFQVPANLPAKDRHLLVVWLAIDESLGEAGGAAGSRSFLANYVDGNEQNLDLNAVRTSLILAHEQTHQLHDLMWRGGPPGPTWLGESTAHYYGLKALRHTGLAEDAVAVAMNAFIDPDRSVEASLVEYNRRYNAGDHDAYGMFYAQGATFWSEVDRLLLTISPEQGGLDALIPNFLGTIDSDGEGLPPSFRALLVECGGPEMDALISRYVGE